MLHVTFAHIGFQRKLCHLALHCWISGLNMKNIPIHEKTYYITVTWCKTAPFILSVLEWWICHFHPHNLSLEPAHIPKKTEVWSLVKILLSSFFRGVTEYICKLYILFVLLRKKQQNKIPTQFYKKLSLSTNIVYSKTILYARLKM